MKRYDYWIDLVFLLVMVMSGMSGFLAGAWAGKREAGKELAATTEKLAKTCGNIVAEQVDQYAGWNHYEFSRLRGMRADGGNIGVPRRLDRTQKPSCCDVAAEWEDLYDLNVETNQRTFLELVEWKCGCFRAWKTEDSGWNCDCPEEVYDTKENRWYMGWPAGDGGAEWVELKPDRGSFRTADRPRGSYFFDPMPSGGCFMVLHDDGGIGQECHWGAR